jgi:opacity protein-like surface antigen
MKIKTIFTASVLLPGLAMGGESHVKQSTSQMSWYAKAEAGLSRPDSTKVLRSSESAYSKLKMKKDGSALELGLGYAFNEFLRTDLMFEYRKLKSKPNRSPTAAFNIRSALLSGYLDAANNTIFTPHVMAGLGATSTQIKGTDANFTQSTIKKTKTSFTWTAGIGARIKVIERADVDFGYRFTCLGKYNIEEQNGTTLKIKNIYSNEVLAGIILRL